MKDIQANSTHSQLSFRFFRVITTNQFDLCTVKFTEIETQI